jgi:YidC/Oxa1 family membrane protein insertase
LDWLIEPFMPLMVQGLMFFYRFFGSSFVLSLALLTIIVRLLTLPLMLPMQKSARKQAEIQPQIQAIRKKYAKDQQKQNEELMKLYREAGINPTSGCLPMLIQLPIMFAFYRAIVQVLAFKPGELLFGLGKYIASSAAFSTLVPMRSNFLWLNLATPDKTYILPLLVGLTTWLQQKLTPSTASSGGEDQAQAMSRSMMFTMPLMFAFITINLASGLAVYFVISNLVGMAFQYFINRSMPVHQLAGRPAGKPAAVNKTTSALEPKTSQASSQSKGRAQSASKRKSKGKRKRK